ncbi:MAG: hypothetical protein Q4Q23_00255 [Methanobacteriaceae archaeon]|nr:hypothetical protein [Methanobacteriaceae archaeon]
MVPDIKLAHKFEKVLKIKIIEKLNSEIDEQKHVNKFRQVTIGDIAHIKKNK